MYNSYDYNNACKYLPQGRSNLDYYDIKYFLPGNNVNYIKKTQDYIPNNQISPSRIYSFWNEGKPNINNINYTNSMKKERKGQVLSLLSALKNNEINVSSIEKEKMMDALMKALESLTEKPVIKVEKESNINNARSVKNTKVDTIEEIYFGGKKKLFLDHPYLKNNISENTEVSDKVLKLIDYYINQNKKEQYLNFNPQNHSFKGNRDCQEFVDNFERIRFNSLSHDNPDYKDKKNSSTNKEEDYTVIKFSNDKPKYDMLKMNNHNRHSQSVDPNRTIIKIFNTNNMKEETMNKIKILNNLNKNGNVDVISKYNIPRNIDGNINLDEYKLEKSKVEVNELFGKPAIIKNDPSKEIKGNKVINNNLRELKIHKIDPNQNDLKAVQADDNNEGEKAKEKSKVEEYLKMLKNKNINLSRRAKVK